MGPKTFGAETRRRRIAVFRLGKIWAFKHFFGDKEIFKELADHYNQGRYRFEFETTTEMDEALKTLEMNGFDVDLVEEPSGYVVCLEKNVKYAEVLKNSVEYAETQNERIFLMKDLASVEEALSLGAEIYEGVIPF